MVERLRNRLEIADFQTKLTLSMQRSRDQDAGRMDAAKGRGAQEILQQYGDECNEYKMQSRILRQQIEKLEPITSLPSPRGCFEYREANEIYTRAKTVLRVMIHYLQKILHLQKIFISTFIRYLLFKGLIFFSVTCRHDLFQNLLLSHLQT